MNLIGRVCSGCATAMYNRWLLKHLHSKHYIAILEISSCYALFSLTALRSHLSFNIKRHSSHYSRFPVLFLFPVRFFPSLFDIKGIIDHSSMSPSLCYPETSPHLEAFIDYIETTSERAEQLGHSSNEAQH